jgi:hypothetical protein
MVEGLAARLTPKQIKELLQSCQKHKNNLANTGGGLMNNPRPITQRELDLIALYGYCQLQITPQQFYGKWQVTHKQLALICSRSVSTVGCWFTRGEKYRPPHPHDLRQLALMDFLLEHFEEIPKPLFELLCPPK